MKILWILVETDKIFKEIHNEINELISEIPWRSTEINELCIEIRQISNEIIEVGEIHWKESVVFISGLKKEAIRVDLDLSESEDVLTSILCEQVKDKAINFLLDEIAWVKETEKLLSLVKRLFPHSAIWCAGMLAECQPEGFETGILQVPIIFIHYKPKVYVAFFDAHFRNVLIFKFIHLHVALQNFTYLTDLLKASQL